LSFNLAATVSQLFIFCVLSVTFVSVCEITLRPSVRPGAAESNGRNDFNRL
jgi:hypothetical protein